MLDYIFFHKQPFESFVQFLNNKGIEFQCHNSEEGFTVQIADNLDEQLSDEIEQEYDRLFEMNQQLMDQPETDNAAGVVVNLKDGSTVYADIKPEVLAKILEVISAEKFGEVVNAIADAVENPDRRALCERVKDKQNNSR